MSLPLTVLLLAAGLAAGQSPAQEPLLPPPDPGLVLGAAGVPRPLMGPEDAPTFAAGYSALAAAGFDRFVPVFLVREDGAGTSHGTYYLPPLPELGISDERSCVGPWSAWRDLPAGFRIDLPAPLLLADQPTDQPWPDGLVRQRLALLLDRCLEGDTGSLGAGIVQDEPVNAYVASLVDETPGTYELDNVGLLADSVRELWRVPALLVEAPLPFMLPYLGATPEETRWATERFREALDDLTPTADRFGFDLYPVDLTPDLTPVYEYAALARRAAPDASPLFVLQGSGYRDTGIELGVTGRPPTATESRAMAYLALLGGARSLYWYGSSATHLEDGEPWDHLVRLVGELRRTSGIFALDSRELPTDGPVVARRYSSDGQSWVVAVNPTNRPSTLRLTTEEIGPRIGLRHIPGGQPVPSIDGSWRIEMSAHETTVVFLGRPLATASGPNTSR